MRSYWVYVMASRSRVLYTGVTNDLARRVEEHRRGVNDGFTKKYRISRLVYFEEFADIRDANCAREADQRLGAGAEDRANRTMQPHVERLGGELVPEA
jgi:putative endonuclease